MKNKLLITTTLVATAFIVNEAFAQPLIVQKGEKLTISTKDTTSNVNSSTNGGVVVTAGELTVEDGVKFEHNTAQTGAAIHTSDASNPTTIGNNVEFNYNISGQGALFNQRSETVLGNDAHFVGNIANSYSGGAIYQDSDSTFTKLTIGKNAYFSQNTSKVKDGGAIMNYNNGKGSVINFGSNAVFEENSAARYGGAIANWSGVITFEGDSTFTDNTATDKGGAIYNADFNIKASEIIFNGKTVFSNNKAADSLNDIYNSASVVFKGDVELDGGIAGKGTTTFANGTSLTVNTGTTVIENDVINQGATLNLKLDNGYIGEYVLVSGNLDKEFTIAENNIYNIIADENKAGTYRISTKTAEDFQASNNISGNQAKTIAAVISGNSANETFNQTASNMADLLQSSNQADVNAALDAAIALAPEVSPMTQSVQTQTVTQIIGAVSTRLSGGSISTGAEGISAGDNFLERASVWIKGLFNKSKLDNSANEKGFDADTNGVAFGIEKYVSDDVKAGLAYAYTDTDIDGFLRDTDVKTHSAVLYGEYKPSNWYINAMATYGWSDYKEKKDVLGSLLRAKYDVETFGLQAMYGYGLHVKNVDITPEGGLRYILIKQDAYTDTAGTRVASDDINVLTAVIGAKVSKTFAFSNGMNLKPQLRVAATYDLTHNDNQSVVSLANGAAYTVDGKDLRHFGVEIGAGLRAELNDHIEFSFGYEGKFRTDYQDHTGLISLKHKF